MWRLVLLSLLAVDFGLVEVKGNFTDTPAKLGFEVDYENNQFLLDGLPFRYVAGSFHYFRTPKQYWRDRLRKLRAAGLNAVSTYVEWSLHQPEPGTWLWSGNADIVEFLNIAKEEDLYVLLRPGPYICAERDLGGLPYWLLRDVPDIRLRSRDTRYMHYVEIYLNEVLRRVKPFLRGNGGPIIMVQVENEYGSYHACDSIYMQQLRDIFNNNVGSDALLYTTDGATSTALRCGVVPGAYVTVDFGTSSNVTKSFEIMRRFQPRGPLVNSEFYPGWLSHWEEPFQTVKTHTVKKKLDEILSKGASVNIYMFYGGTNFGFTSGANGDSEQYSPQLTSYDYDAPLTEAGDPTHKYFQIRNVISKYLPLPALPLPTISPKGDYGTVSVYPILRLFSTIAIRLFGTSPVQVHSPPTFESIGINHWLVLYETTLPKAGPDPGILQADVKDRGLIYVADRLVGTLSRTRKINSMPLEGAYGKPLKILVENQGHLNFGNEIEDFKGVSNVTVNDVILFSWNVTGFRLNSLSQLRGLQDIQGEEEMLHGGPVFLRGSFTVSDTPLDTYLDTSGWGKGIAFVNGHNLGRYWPLAGPQITLYVPAPYLRKGLNELVLLELEYVPITRKIKFQPTPNLNTLPETADEENLLDES
ncbi:beta-galactosidase [Orussus abietinus]|uniref:beta-galactosidase n=1 Tax=Orussus abietinus TaxID=222816 RepID=UPI000625ECD7|nr:beta-galactosidase [Orussus abietinus]